MIWFRKGHPDLGEAASRTRAAAERARAVVATLDELLVLTEPFAAAPLAAAATSHARRGDLHRDLETLREHYWSLNAEAVEERSHERRWAERIEIALREGRADFAAQAKARRRDHARNAAEYEAELVRLRLTMARLEERLARADHGA
jgi:hypothetical protein